MQSGTGKFRCSSPKSPILSDQSPGVLIDCAKGMFASDTIYSDNNIEKIESLSPTQPHRNVDLEIVKADREGLYHNIIFK
jgi:hypothetical protein